MDIQKQDGFNNIIPKMKMHLYLVLGHEGYEPCLSDIDKDWA